MSSLPLAARMATIDSFYVMEIHREAVALQALGKPVIFICVGEPDFDAAPELMDAADAAVRGGHTHYTVALGILPLREKISALYKSRYGLDVPPERIAVTAGASGAMLIAFGTLVNPGDEWLMPDPTYPCNRRFVSLYGGTTKLIPTGPAENYQLTAELVERHWGPSTKGVMLASPSNPTGTMVPPAEMRAIHEVVRAKGGVLVVDEIYHGLTYATDATGNFIEPPSALSISEDLIVINSFSKYFTMTGWRLGWMVAPLAHMKALEKLAQNLFICPSAIAQEASLACFSTKSLALFEERRREFKARRDYLVPALRALGFIVPQVPEGAFYVYADVSAFIARGFAKDSWEFCMKILHQAHVAITPGKDFGTHRADQHVRISYTIAVDELRTAIARMKAVLT